MTQAKSIIFFLLLTLPLVYTQKSENDNESSNSKPKYGVAFHLYGLCLIILSSAVGTILPILLRNKAIFSINGTLFNSMKMFGTGVIVTVAFVHMLSPADKMLSGDDAPEFFKENYDAFSGVFAIAGIILAHGIQIIVKEYFKKQKEKTYNNLEVEHSRPDILIHNNECNSTSTESDSLLSQGKNNYNNNNNNNIDSDSDSKNNSKIEEQENHSSTADYNSCSHHDNNVICHEQFDDCCHTEVLFLTSNKQIVSYLLEIGISLHSILIGFAFGTNFDNDINFLLIALMIHQFFEGIALSTIFIEAKFKNLLAPILMVIFYSITMPLGGIGGLIVYGVNHTNTTTMTCIQGILDSLAAGLLIYDSLVNILSHHTSSSQWDKMNKMSKYTQLVSFYLGCIAMALIGIWA